MRSRNESKRFAEAKSPPKLQLRNKKLKALVTGASGFCGRYLSSYLLDKGYAVAGTYCRQRMSGALPGMAFHPLEMSDADQVASLVRTERPDVVFHLAALSIPRLSWGDEVKTFEVNVAGTIHLLDALRRFAPQTRFLMASSVQVYGRAFRQGNAVRESDLIWPESPYAVSKAIAELACLDYYNRFGMCVIIARAFNHIGAGQGANLVLSDWSRQVALAENDYGRRRLKTLKVGNLDARRQFLHVADVVEAYELLIRNGNPGKIYNISLEKTDILRDYADRLVRSARVPLKIEVERQRFRREDPHVMRGTSARLRALGWKPRRTAFEALEEMLHDWRRKVAEETEKFKN